MFDLALLTLVSFCAAALIVPSASYRLPGPESLGALAGRIESNRDFGTGDEAAAARLQAAPETPLRRGDGLSSGGGRIEEGHLALLEGMRRQMRAREFERVRLGAGGLIGLVIFASWRFARRNPRRFRPVRRDVVFLATVAAGTFALGSLGFVLTDALEKRIPGVPPSSLRYMVPLAAGAMLVRQVMTAEVALLFSLVAGIGGGMLSGQSMAFAAYTMLTSLSASALSSGTRDRAGLIRAGAMVGLLGAAAAVATGLHSGLELVQIGVGALASLVAGGVVMPVVVAGLLPVLQGVFGYVTDVKLQALANLDQPALKELIVHAPGTYHHSILMGSLVDAAAREIGANPLLARVCAYYHDIGKIRNPRYFAENQHSENPHETLAGSMSALIVKRHVADGIELARRWKLPTDVTDVIGQHHGTMLMSYFHAKAHRSAEGGARVPREGRRRGLDLEESLFRYPGPRPQTKEAALVMIADCCEAASRALTEPGGEEPGALVRRCIHEIFREGQLDECDLTFRDLDAVAGAMTRALEKIRGARPDPQPVSEEDDPASPGIRQMARQRP